MLPRERVELALNHKEPDHIPIDLGGTLVSSITRKAYVDLRKYLGMPEEEIRMLDYVQQLPYLDEGFMQRFRSDFRLAQMPALTAQGINLAENGQNYEFYNKWGTKLQMPRVGGLYYDYVDFPIKEPTEEALRQYSWPGPNPPEYYHRLGEQARYLYDHTDYAVVGGVIIGGGIFEQPARLMGLENFFTALISEPKVADEMMEKVTDIYVEASNAYLDAVGNAIQVFTYWDDVCGQNGWLIRPEIYIQRVKPRQKRLVEAIRARTGAKLFYHGCGAVYDLIPHLIEIGFDIINPVQVSARGMDTRRLKQSYGKDIVFWGGGVDSQRTLPFGTPSQVADEVKRRIDDLAPGGGFVFDVVHNIQAFVPPENIIAAYETAYDYGWY
jgi:uroporphyrinogen decarboxylase